MATARYSAADSTRRVRLAGWLAVVTVGIAVVGFPLFDLTREIVTAGGSAVAEVLGSGRTWGPIGATLWTSLVVTVMTLVGATAAAIAIAGVRGRRRLIVGSAMVLPFLIPPFVSALSWFRPTARVA